MRRKGKGNKKAVPGALLEDSGIQGERARRKETLRLQIKEVLGAQRWATISDHPRRLTGRGKTKLTDAKY